MFASTKFLAAFSVLAAAAAAVSAAPAKVFEPTNGNVDVVFRPHITAPTAGVVWQAGSSQTITWDASNIPAENQNQTGLILLGYIEDGDVNEHLDIQHPLAVNFPITAGSVTVNVPQVPARDDYVIVVFGDSGNASPKFTITNSTTSASSAVQSATSFSIPSASSFSFPALPTA
ncbi:hypothetical protein DICSQDRAFT_134768 [Dichomitus squalens LYAD-421 SS1]|uniref:Yeast cell wall synthesis Kre9/Knh1-like N-terminal domain-containing protein n=1 Tax=Dichomitus squalens TaxID=114155 RepID=A0A4Q9PFN0_9APHY|nr:uncharacterized protein DICSQDRAFT_134768 [Dichomitus squalens LYAD-421 SS1]EJF63335.1 hypothetical protein DICSQDRAFT_134768 [Dichomitus squalens LYAD-421 SS1]TBU53658.1 hypothetical protein BD310DRAFT_829635 [Dichomitus squalens]